jgi:nitrate/nitrite transport system substrate-binding protein
MWTANRFERSGRVERDYKIITIPPPQMVLNLQMGNIDGFSAGEPWNGLAAERGAGWTFMASQDIWANQPEKALVCLARFRRRTPRQAQSA